MREQIKLLQESQRHVYACDLPNGWRIVAVSQGLSIYNVHIKKDAPAGTSSVVIATDYMPRFDQIGKHINGMLDALNWPYEVTL